jgi:putative transposase
MCKHLKVSKSGYYDWQDRAPSARAVANMALLDEIKTIHAMSDATYGMPRIRAELLDVGVHASRKRIAHLMREAHLQASVVAVATRSQPSATLKNGQHQTW